MLVKNIKIVEGELVNILRELEKNMVEIYGDKLKQIILYGSYARKSNTEGSDLDIMVLVDMDHEELKKLHDRVLDITVELTTRYGIVLSIIENNYNYFYEWLDVLPFFKNVEQEGVVLYG